jgi:hypothetical protein
MPNNFNAFSGMWPIVYRRFWVGAAVGVVVVVVDEAGVVVDEAGVVAVFLLLLRLLRLWSVAWSVVVVWVVPALPALWVVPALPAVDPVVFVI